MIVLSFLPVVLSLLVLGAHFLRTGNMVLVAAALAPVVLLGVRRRWAARVIQLVLVIGAVEWIRTLVALAAARAEAGQPLIRLCLILGGVALLTALSALVFRTASARAWFRMST